MSSWSGGRRKTALVAVAVLVVLLAALFVRSPVGRAVFKSKRHFVRHTADRRVFYEAGAETYAARIAQVLPATVSQVEQSLSGRFVRPFRVYICSSQRSHNEFIANPPSWRIRGSVLLGNVYLAPSAFDFYGYDTHQQSLAHELVHLYLSQRLGFLRSRRIPVWFVEGLANCIAGTSGEGVDESAAVSTIRDGRRPTPEEQGSLLQTVQRAAGGLAPRVYQLQNRMFVQFLMERYPSSFERALQEVLKGRPFARSFYSGFHSGVNVMWKQFKASPPMTRGHDREPYTVGRKPSAVSR
jgi:hypothetical protein